VEDEVFKALADASRRKLLDRLRKRDGQTLGELCRHVDMTRFGVMKHLRVLERARLVVSRKVGREKHHHLNPMPIRLIHDRWVSKYAAPFAAALSQLKTNLEDPMADDKTQVYELFIRTTPEKLWRAISAPEFTTKYFFGTHWTTPPKTGAPWKSVDGEGNPMVDGMVLECDPPNRLVHTWHILYDKTVSHEESRVTWLFEARG
jgi:DNA-binding transcriptional ArsR family regulator